MADTRRCSSLVLLIAMAVASLGTDCGRAPRGSAPSELASIVVRLNSVTAPDPPPELAEWLSVCLRRMNDANNVEPSWENYETVLMDETAPNVFEARFNYVPVAVVHTMVVHDVNECRRNPRDGIGRVTTGVTVNGTPILLVRPASGSLQFWILEDGEVRSDPAGPGEG